jgi:integrase
MRPGLTSFQISVKFWESEGEPTMIETRGRWGDGHVEGNRGKNTWRLQYRVNGKRYSATFHGSKSDAKRELRRLLTAGDDGLHVDPHRMTVEQWVEHWISIGCPGKKKTKPSPRTVERYTQLLRTHVLPEFGDCRLQKLSSDQIDKLYTGLASKAAARTCHHVHIVLGAALGTAKRKAKISVNPMDKLASVPSPGEADHGIALDKDELRELVDGFNASPIHAFIAVAAYTGMRRNEIAALQWNDFDATKKVLQVRRAVEQIKGSTSFKPPKTKRGNRDIALSDELTALLCAEREKYLRIVAGVPEGVAVDLSLVRLPNDALIFPSPAGLFSMMRVRDPHAVTRAFTNRRRSLAKALRKKADEAARAKREAEAITLSERAERFARVRLHDLRGSHITQLLRQGVQPDIVARRLGDDPATMWKFYVKTIRGDDTAERNALAALSGNPPS